MRSRASLPVRGSRGKILACIPLLLPPNSLAAQRGAVIVDEKLEPGF